MLPVVCGDGDGEGGGDDEVHFLLRERESVLQEGEEVGLVEGVGVALEDRSK